MRTGWPASSVISDWNSRASDPPGPPPQKGDNEDEGEGKMEAGGKMEMGGSSKQQDSFFFKLVGEVRPSEGTKSGANLLCP